MSEDSVFTELLRRYAAQASDNDTGRAMVPAVMLSDAAAVIDDYRQARADLAARIKAATEEAMHEVLGEGGFWHGYGDDAWFDIEEATQAVLAAIEEAAK